MEPDWDNNIKDFLIRQLSFSVDWEQPGVNAVGLQKLSHQLIENITISIIQDFNPSILSDFKYFPIDNFIIYLKENFNLETITDQIIPIDKGKKLNGYCDIENKKIFIDVSLRDTEQFAFVCAHEIAHFFLHTNVQMSQMIYDNLNDSAYDSATGKYLLTNEKHWLEWQANQFAAALIMPYRCVLGKLEAWQMREGISKLGSVF